MAGGTEEGSWEWQATRRLVLSGEGGTEAQRAAVKRQDRIGFGRKDKLCSWCWAEHNRLMECVSMDNPPHPRDPQSSGSKEATARSRAFIKLARSRAFSFGGDR